MVRHITKKVKIGNTYIGGDSLISIQSMTNTLTEDINKTIAQIKDLEAEGCDIIRCAVYDEKSALALSKIKEQIHIPLVADIHFNYKLAILAMENGADKVRINPGNIGGKSEIKKVADAAKSYGIPIRVGANSGSLSKSVLNKFGSPSAKALVQSALSNIKLLEDCGFYDLIISIKSSSPVVCIKAARMMSHIIDYPLHLGVTEAGTYKNAIIKSSAVIGSLLMDGIGDTIRISISGDPLKEIIAGKEILNLCGIRNESVNIISCPTCARCSLDIEKIVDLLSNYTNNIKLPITIAIMGCSVNGPGEAKEADIGIAGGKDEALLFMYGKIIKKINNEDILTELLQMIDKFLCKK